jgi:hypothetical protein
MPQLSTDWSGWHAIITHLSLIPLLVAPLLVIVGAVLPTAKRPQVLGSALALMVLGTAMTFADLTAGEGAIRAVSATPAFRAALEEHQALVETTRALFVVLTLGFAALLIVPRLLGRELEPRVHTLLLAVYLVSYASGVVFLVHTALQDGRLVRELEAKTAAACQLSGKEGAK